MSDPVRLVLAEPQVRQDGTVLGEVLYVDRFGNLVTNIPQELLPLDTTLRTQVAGREVRGPLTAYALAAGGELLTLVGSSGYFEIAVRDGSAAAALEIGCGARVVVYPVADSGESVVSDRCSAE